MVETSANLPTVSAHRGWHVDGAPKNSIAALEAAVANGADSVEIDVRRLGDGTLVVHHDATLPDGRLLAEVDARVLAEFPDVPTLDDWARRAGELGAHALVELKEAGYEDDVVATLRRYVPDSQLEFFSFRSSAVRALSRILPDRPVGLLSRLETPAVAGAELVRNARSSNATFLGLNVGQTGDDVLQAAADAKLGVKVWTVDDPGDIWRLVSDPRVHTIISDRPDLALAYRGSIREALDVQLAEHVLARAGTSLDDAVTTIQRVASTIR